MRLRVTAPVSRKKSGTIAGDDVDTGNAKPWVRYDFPLNFLTAPLIADLFLLAILAIGRDEVYGGTISADNIEPLEILIFFITLAYIAISIDASGLIRYLAFKVLQKGGEVGHRLFFYLYSFFFVLGSFVGNDPIILSGTAFLAYMTRVSSNIVHPRAWIHTQFAVANIASAILVSSNPTNLVLAGAFGIKFFIYTANMVVPVVVTSIVLFPFLLYIVFADEALIPSAIKMHELPEEAREKKPVNPNIPHARGTDSEEENSLANGDQTKLLSLEEIMNPFLDKGGATAGAVIMAATLICILLINALSDLLGHQPVYYVTLPAAFLMLCWDLAFGWLHREETRSIARKGRRAVEYSRARKDIIEQDEQRTALHRDEKTATSASNGAAGQWPESNQSRVATEKGGVDQGMVNGLGLFVKDADGMEKATVDNSQPVTSSEDLGNRGSTDSEEQRIRDLNARVEDAVALRRQPGPTTLSSLTRDAIRWTQETFPTVAAVAAHLPVALVPFSFCMFILVQALVSKGWVAVFAYGWTHWVDKTGTIGAIGGMAFVSVIMCNVSLSHLGVALRLPSELFANLAVSSPEPILVPPSCFVVSYNTGWPYTSSRASPSPTASSGRRCIAWRWALTMALSASPSVPRSPGSSGVISSRGSTSTCARLNSHASIFPSSPCPWLWDAPSSSAKFTS